MISCRGCGIFYITSSTHHLPLFLQVAALAIDIFTSRFFHCQLVGFFVLYACSAPLLTTLKNQYEMAADCCSPLFSDFPIFRFSSTRIRWKCLAAKDSLLSTSQRLLFVYVLRNRFTLTPLRTSTQMLTLTPVVPKSLTTHSSPLRDILSNYLLFLVRSRTSREADRYRLVLNFFGWLKAENKKRCIAHGDRS